MARVLDRLGSLYDTDRFVSANGESAFRVLIGCLLSLRTKDEVTYPATERLFARASTPATMLDIREASLARLIYPVGFYRRKAAQIRSICRELIVGRCSSIRGVMRYRFRIHGIHNVRSAFSRTEQGVIAGMPAWVVEPDHVWITGPVFTVDGALSTVRAVGKL